MSRAIHGAEIVHCHDALKHRDIGIGKGTAVGYASVIDQQIYAAKTLDHLTDRLRALLVIRHITVQCHDVSVELIVQLLTKGNQGFILDIENGDVGASLGKAQCQRTANAGAATGNYDYFLLKDSPAHIASSTGLLAQPKASGEWRQAN
tara:strand:+ start:81 stop:527 length:447 start_codon:yes stop_codon:yes gene_type:complete